MAEGTTPTQEEFLKKVEEWAAKKGRQPNTIEARQIYADMLAEGTAQTEEERNRQEKIDKQELTDAGLKSLAAQLVGQNQTGPVVQEMPPVVRAVTADSKNLIDPLTGKAIKEISRGSKEGTYNYSGMNLVDENGYIVQSNITDNSGNAAANVLFQEMKANGQLPKFLQALKASDHYYGKSPSSMALNGQGLTPNDYNAIDSFINSANLARYTPKGYLALMEKNPGAFSGGAGGGSGSSVAYPNEQDMMRTIKNESFAALGRPLTPPEIKVAINFIKQSYAAASGSGGEQAPSLQAAAETAVAQTAGEEGAVYNLGIALDRIFAGQGSI
jgi:hypothetical protein